MEQKKFTNTALVALVIALVGIVGFTLFRKPAEQKSSSQSIGTLAQVAANIIPAGGSQPIQSPVGSESAEPVQSATSSGKIDLPATGVAGSGLPVRLLIPIINVDAVVQYVGVETNGAMVAPEGLKDVAWLKTGPRPGDIGSAVIAGHYGAKYGIVFNNLHKLKKGDDVYVEGDGGERLHFIVRESRTYDPNADAAEVFGSSDGKAHLNLITCEGVWNRAKKTYSNRLVVFTDKQSE